MKTSSEGLAAGLLAIAAAVLGALAPAHSDTWWLLRAGETIVTTATIPLTDTYSWTAAGSRWPNHEWLSEAAFYVAHALAGMPGLALLTASLILIAGIVAWRLADGPFEVRFAAFAVALVSSTSVFAMRPQVFTLAAFSLTCLVLRRNRIWWLPPLIVLWVNFHGAAVLGVVAIGAAWLSDAISRDRRADHHRLLPFAVAALLSGLALLASPLGATIVTFIPESTARLRSTGHIEWAAPGAAPQHWPFWLAAVAFVILTVSRWRALDLHRRRIVAAAAAMLPLALQSMRNVPFFLLAALPAIVLLAAAGQRSRRAAVRENERLNGAILGALAAAAAILVALIWMRPPPALGWTPVSGDAARAIAGCGRPLYNVYGRGGELIWFVREQKVFLDNRQDPYPTSLLVEGRQLEQDGRFQPLFDRYGIQCAAVPPESIVSQSLRAAPDWALAFEDPQWVVFTRRPK